MSDVHPSTNEFDESAEVVTTEIHVDIVEVDVVEDGIEVDVVEIDVEAEEYVDEAIDVEPDFSRNAQPTQGALALNIRTGDDRVDDAVASLQVLDDLPVEQHAQVFDHVHQALQGALTDIGRD